MALTKQQEIALIYEMGSVRYLLRHGTNVIRETTYVERTIDPILTSLSIGVEKLLKLALGLSDLAEGGSWPSQAKMQKEYGHGVDAMDALLRDRLNTTIELNGSSQYVRDLLAGVDSDPVWPPVRRALDAYGRSGRFYYLDILGEKPQVWQNPRDLWQEAETAAVQSDDAIRAVYSRAIEENSQPLFDEVVDRLHHLMADSIERWWEMITVLGRNGLLGSMGRNFGFETHPNSAGPRTPRRFEIRNE